jgi:uncharacterized membrane protein YkvA (DUF1232 family)
MTETIKKIGRRLKSSAHLLYRIRHDARVPGHIRLIALLAITYLISPIDIIPDFIPVLGMLDEIILIPLLLMLILYLLPAPIRDDYRPIDE